MEQSFYGNYLEFYFIAIMGITLAIQRLFVRAKYTEKVLKVIPLEVRFFKQILYISCSIHVTSEKNIS